MTDKPEPADDAAAPENETESQIEENTFPASYVRELRAENARRRTNERKLESTIKDLAAVVGGDASEPEGLPVRARELMEQSVRNRTLAEEVLLTSRFAQLAAEHVVVDPDAARRLLDMSGVKVDLETREVEGLEEAMETRCAVARRLAEGQALLALEQGFTNCLGLALAGELGDLGGELLDLLVLDAHCHPGTSRPR